MSSPHRRLSAHAHLLVVGVSLVAAVLLAWRAPAAVQGRDLEKAYRQILDRYLSGDPDGAVRELEPWDRAKLEALRQTHLLALHSLGAVEERAVLEAAAVLHTRVAVRRSEALTASAPRDHLDLSRWLVGRLVFNRTSPAFVRAWYLAVGTYLVAGITPSAFLAHAAEMRRLFPTDPEVLVCLGVGFEKAADSSLEPSPEVEAFVPPELARVPAEGGPPGPQVGMRRARWLDLAASQYRAALARAADDEDARLRLARVLLVVGRPAEAIPELARAERAPAAPLRFLAALYLGRALDARGRDAEAVEAYRRACALFPDARSSTFALSEAMNRGGDVEGAKGVLEGFLRRVSGARLTDDPWWVSRNDWSPRLAAALARLHAAVAR
jgi:tetratricopeptide (TPR) repeat protein